jgi:hypothetical protein
VGADAHFERVVEVLERADLLANLAIGGLFCTMSNSASKSAYASPAIVFGYVVIYRRSDY